MKKVKKQKNKNKTKVEFFQLNFRGLKWRNENEV